MPGTGMITASIPSDAPKAVSAGFPPCTGSRPSRRLECPRGARAGSPCAPRGIMDAFRMRQRPIFTGLRLVASVQHRKSALAQQLPFLTCPGGQKYPPCAPRLSLRSRCTSFFRSVRTPGALVLQPLSNKTAPKRHTDKPRIGYSRILYQSIKNQ